MTETQSLEEAIHRALGRRVTREQIATAIGISLATYARRKADGVPADDVLRAARYFRLSPVGLLVSVGIVDLDDVRTAAGLGGVDDMDDVTLLQELLERATVRQRRLSVVRDTNGLEAIEDAAAEPHRPGEIWGQDEDHTV